MEESVDSFTCNNIITLKKASKTEGTKIRLMEENDIYESFNFELTTWEPEHLHWVAPSKIILFSNGDLSATAAHIANMRRLGGIFDTGGFYHAAFDLGLQETADSKPFMTLSYAIAGLPYKKSVQNVKKLWSLPGLPPYIEKANYASLIQRWTGGEIPPPPVIPLPPIEFP
ncbi:hypothetical protein ABQG55_04800 [Aeromonas dhakensis]|uniref:hypothetical protein n=1 Tax=Aeromonas dhakensis TaxID=196024 RepID=UPI0032F030EE